jgi:hypothetical protein
MARITDTNSEGHELTLQLAEPIILLGNDMAPEVRLESVRFVPNDPSRSTYSRHVVSGKLLPAISEGLFATARIVVYPNGS